MRYVLDTSVVAKWFSQAEETGADKALQLRDDYLNELCELTISDLVLYELENLLRYKPDFDMDKIHAALESLRFMRLEVISYTYEVGQKAAQIATEYNVTIYDAYFAALGAHLRCQAITADERCYEKLSSLPWTLFLPAMTF